MSEIMRWEPFRELVSLREAMDRLFAESYVRPWGVPARLGEAGLLPVDMYETEESVVIKAAVPGMNPDDLDISIAGDTVTIRGETRREDETSEDGYHRRELYYGSFCRSLPLPTQVMAEDAEAVFENGMLTLTLPKAEEVKPKSIKIKAK